MEITDEQRKRAEANRIAALSKLKRASSAASTAAAAPEAANQNAWKLFKCQKIMPRQDPGPSSKPEIPMAEKFCVVLEICALDAFSATPEPVKHSPFPGQSKCLEKIATWISAVDPSISSHSQCGQLPFVYKLKDYDLVVKCLKRLPRVSLQEVPWKTLAVVKRFSPASVGDCWMPCMPYHLSDDEVDVLLGKLPKVLRDVLLPFQMDGVRFALRRGARCLIADEMGLGKTIQAIAIASCFIDEGPILIVCPAILRYSWAEELERWLPSCLPTDIHLVFGHQNNLIYLKRCPKVVVVSFKMLHRLRRSMLQQEWALMIVDECHTIRCTKKVKESEETQTVLDVAEKAQRIVLLSGTPSLSRPYDIFHQINILWPGLLGKDKYEFANNYCSIKYAHGSQGKLFMDFSNGIRLGELSVLIKQTVMIRRLKENLLQQLPPKRRKVLRLVLKGPDIVSAVNACGDGIASHMSGRLKRKSVINSCTYQHGSGGDADTDISHENSDQNCCRPAASKLSYQELGLAKLSGFCEWLSNHSIIRESEGSNVLDPGAFQKMLIFAHHLKVLDGVQEFACEKGIRYIRIDGSTLAKDRQEAVLAFKSSAEVRLAIIGITAGGVGLDLSAAKSIVFLELPKTASEMLQAEDRAHRRGQTNAVNIYIFCAKDTSDESHWQHLNRSLFRISSVMNGKDDAIPEIQVDRVCDLEVTQGFTQVGSSENSTSERSIVEHSEAVAKYSGTFQKSEAILSEQPNGDRVSLLQTGVFSSKVSSANGFELMDSGTVLKSDENACGAVYEMATSQKASMNISIQAHNLHSISSEENSSEALIKAHGETDCIIQADSIRFEVSLYTGRIHLYACVQGMDARPRPMFENFHPEELESMIFSTADVTSGTFTKAIKDNSAYRSVILAFIKEWNDLRSIDRNKLLGKPLRLPLSLELHHLKESFNHEKGGLLKGGSKRRVTPLCDISNPLPPDAAWRKILLHGGYSKKDKEYLQAWTIADEPLCKLCQTPCEGKLAREPEFFEDLFCNLSCYDEYRIRTSQKSLRMALFQLEHGVCTYCKLDCHKLVECIKRLSASKRKEHIEKEAPNVANRKSLLDKLVNEPTEGNAWHADHIVPVYKGGGECKLDNMRTLCVACHLKVTAAQLEERKLMRIHAKDELKVLMKKLKDGAEQSQPHSGLAEQPSAAATGDELLLVRVPGSAYSSVENTIPEAHGGTCTQ